MDKIAKSQQLRDYQRYQIRDLKLQYLQERKEELNQKMKILKIGIHQNHRKVYMYLKIRIKKIN